jgi:hypothetical protein
LENDERCRVADEEILHVIEIASMFSFTGRLANTLGLLANPEYADLGRRDE